MIAISCPGKFHAFSLAEQLNLNNRLARFYTGYAYQKNSFFRHFTSRIDKEEIPSQKISTYLRWAMQTRLKAWDSFELNCNFDRWVARNLKVNPDNYRVFIGWASISLESILQAKTDGKLTILERGSSHILFQNEILNEEFKNLGKEFNINPSVIEKELLEYEEADYISIPSDFVKDTFIKHGVSRNKLFVNPYGAGVSFNIIGRKTKSPGDKFIVVYLGTLSVRKGLIYLFEAIQLLKIPKDQIEFWFVGSVLDEVIPWVNKYKSSNWKFFGHVNHYKLRNILMECDVGVQPSIEEGLSMVIPQLLGCGVPVVVTTNTGGQNIITDEYNGYIVPIRQPFEIAGRIEFLFANEKKLNEMKIASSESIKKGFTWADYGDRYIKFLNSVL